MFGECVAPVNALVSRLLGYSRRVMSRVPRPHSTASSMPSPALRDEDPSLQVAAVDLGSNSFHMMVARATAPNCR